MSLIDLHQHWQLGKDIYWIFSCLVGVFLFVYFARHQPCLGPFKLNFPEQLLSCYELLTRCWAEAVIHLPLAAGR